MSNSNYQKVEYWDNRYSNRPQPFDWLQTLSGLRTLIFKYINKNDNILNIGCGNSRLPETLSDEGYEKITNIDFSQKVIEQISKRYHKIYPKMKFKVMDILNMNEFKENSFEIVIDKGALDCILCGGKSTDNFEKSLSEIYRVLYPGGKYIMISFNKPLYIKKYLNKFYWYIEIFTIDKTRNGSISNFESYTNIENVHYIYIMTSQKVVKKIIENTLILSNNKSINFEKNNQLNTNIKIEINQKIKNIENNEKKKEDNNNKKINIEKNKNYKDDKENNEIIFIKENKNLMKNMVCSSTNKIDQNENMRSNEIKENLLVNENHCIQLKDNNLEKNKEIKSKNIEKNEKDKNKITNEKNINNLSNNALIENYSKEKNNIINDVATARNNLVRKYKMM